MDTPRLRGFAVWARLALMREVAGRVAAVLAPGSEQRVEQPMAVGALERAVTAAGGGEAGRAAVVDAVAYTWFNRIIALRFMDANGYTGVGVVSPQAGVTLGQPEILADAKRGVLDAQVVGSRTQQTVMALVDGTRPSPDPQGEAYGLLLAEYCRFWNQAMPFMFEPEGDYTELLMPANLLADNSVLNRAVGVLTDDVCADVEVIGWLYQFYISERKDEVFAGFKKNKKAGAAEIPAATQLFTPHWIVRYLVENSLGRLWMLNHPDSQLVGQMDYYIPPVDSETDFLKISSPEDIKIIDPACGSGHMLTYAFDLLYAIYQEEGYAPSQIPELILTHNLYGTEIDPRAGALAAFALTMKARQRQRSFFTKQTQPNICVIEPISFTDEELDYLLTERGDRTHEEAFWNQFRNADVLGALIQPDPHLTTQLTQHLRMLDGGGEIHLASVLDRGEQVLLQSAYLAQQYDVVVANPPYMGIKSMDALLAAFAKSEYRDSKSDLFAMFIERCLGMARQRGLVGMITMQAWMFLSSFETLRLRILRESPPAVMAHLGDRAFDSIGGSVVSTTAFVLERGRGTGLPATYFRLVDGDSEAGKDTLARQCRSNASHWLVSTVTAEDFKALPGSPIAYWLPEKILTLVSDSPSIASVLTPRQGLFTTDNARFLRYFWEVSLAKTCLNARSDDEAVASRARWFAHNKGGANRRWFGNYEYVVDWENLGGRIKQTAAEKYPYLKGNVGLVVHDDGYYFRPAISWSEIGDTSPAFRAYDSGFTFNIKGMSAFPVNRTDPLPMETLALLNSPLVRALAPALNPTMSFGVNNFRSLPFIRLEDPGIQSRAQELVEISRRDWDSFETSWFFRRDPLVTTGESCLRTASNTLMASWHEIVTRAHQLELENNRAILATLGLESELPADIGLHEITLLRNGKYRYNPELDPAEALTQALKDATADLISYAVGCMFGRYSLDMQGLVLADQGATVQDYLEKVPAPRFLPDADNVLPVMDGDWFEDDIVARFRQFLRVAFGEQHFEENLRFVTESLGVKDIRDYFVKSFYKDHVQRYKKRPIYWLFSSSKGSFNALIYMHRYTPTTVSMVLNEYLREFQAKVTSSLDNAERSNQAKEADRLRKILVELEEYEHDVLYPLATQQISIDLDDGVKANYPKLGKALKKIPGLEPNQ